MHFMRNLGLRRLAALDLILSLCLCPSRAESTVPMMVQTWRKGIAKIEDPKKRGMTFSKRRKGLFKKANDLNELADAPVAVIVFSTTGKLYSVSKPSVEEIIHRYHRHKGDMIPPMSRRELEDWAKKEYASCATREDLASSIMKHEFVLDYLRKKFKDLENNPVVKAGAGNDSGVGVDGSSKVLNHDKIDPLKDCIRDVDWDYFSILPVDLAASSVSSGVESTPMCSNHENCGIDPNGFLNLPEDSNGFLILAKDLAVGYGSLGEESAHSDLEGYGNNEDDIFARLEDLTSLL